MPTFVGKVRPREAKEENILLWRVSQNLFLTRFNILLCRNNMWKFALPPPSFNICHIWKFIWKHDFSLTPSHLFWQCHDICRIIFWTSSLKAFMISLHAYYLCVLCLGWSERPLLQRVDRLLLPVPSQVVEARSRHANHEQVSDEWWGIVNCIESEIIQPISWTGSSSTSSRPLWVATWECCCQAELLWLRMLMTLSEPA